MDWILKVSASSNEIPVRILIGDLSRTSKKTFTHVLLMYLEHGFLLQMGTNSDCVLPMNAILGANLKEQYYVL